ncbi:hypothetical protein GKODMF_10160 [Candidatus Electrothrix gigas]
MSIFDVKGDSLRFEHQDWWTNQVQQLANFYLDAQFQLKEGEQIAEHELVLGQTQDEAKQEPERVETSNIENYQKFNRVDNEGKKLFDLITSSEKF